MGTIFTVSIEVGENAPNGWHSGPTGSVGWSGPCPPSGTGTHTYFFKLYALSATIDLTNGGNTELHDVEPVTRSEFETAHGDSGSDIILSSSEISATATAP